MIVDAFYLNNLMAKWKLVLWLMAMTLSVHAQHLHVDARIIDAKTGERLPFASVYISGANSTISNAEGEFAIDADSTDVLRISYVGYKTVHLRAVDIGQEVLLSSRAGGSAQLRG